MKRNSIEELAQLLSVRGGTEEESAAAKAVVSALLSQQHEVQSKAGRDAWSEKSGVRDALDGDWKSRLRS